MRILHFIYDHPNNPWVGGGGAVRAYELSKRLCERGHTVEIHSGRFPGALDYSEGNLSYTFIGSERGYFRSTFGYALEATRVIRRHARDFDVIVEDFAPWNPIWAPLLTRRPTVLHINHREKGNILARWKLAGVPFYLIEALYPRLLYRHMTALSEWTRRKVAHPGAVVLPAGINEAILKGERTDKGYALYVGRMQLQNKGLDTLIEAVRGYTGKIRLVMAGRGRDEDRIRGLARGLDVEFQGFVDEDEKLRLMREASVFVLPSRFEGWGIVVLEAAACGCPVLVSSIPELSFATEGGFGLDFRTGDARDLSDKLRLMMEDHDGRIRMGRIGREFAGRYTWEGISVQYENYLRSVIRAEAARR